MPARESEALVLRTYPYREADLIVSFFARDRGKLRGIAKGVRRPKSRFGAGLERLAHARIAYFQKQTSDLVRIDGSELISPALTMRVGYEASTALDFIAEVAEELLPEHEPNDAYFRLIAMALEEMWHETENGSAAWRVVTYFALWSVRLGGWLPPLNVCLESGEELGPDETAYFDPSFEGLLSESTKTGRSRALSPDSRRAAREMLRKPLPALRSGDWDASRCRDLRRFLIERLEGHFEKRLKTARALEAL